MILIIGHAVPLGIAVNNKVDTIPLPYCKQPNNAAAAPAMSPALSRAIAFVTDAIIPFIEKNANTPITIRSKEVYPNAIRLIVMITAATANHVA